MVVTSMFIEDEPQANVNDSAALTGSEFAARTKFITLVVAEGTTAEVTVRALDANLARVELHFAKQGACDVTDPEIASTLLVFIEVTAVGPVDMTMSGAVVD